jgi:hypothetical protein
MIPIFILQTWLLGLLSLGVVGGAVYLAYEWQQRSWGWDPVLTCHGFSRIDTPPHSQSAGQCQKEHVEEVLGIRPEAREL